MSIQRAFRLTPSNQSNPNDVSWLEDFRFSAGSLANGAVVGRFTAGVNGTGASIVSSSLGVDAVSMATGSVALSTGTTTTGRALLQGAIASVEFTSGSYELRGRLFMENLSTSAEEFSFSFGYHDALDSTTLNAQDGAWFRYNRAVDGDFWTCHTANNSDQDPTNPTNHTKTVTTVGVVAGTANVMQRLRIKVENSIAQFFIDDVLVAVHTTNVSGARGTGMGCRILKSAGSTARKVAVDYIGERYVAGLHR